MKTAMTSAALALALAAAACASSGGLPPVRYQNQAPVEVVDDRRPLAKPPGGREPYVTEYFYEGYVHRRISRSLAVPRPQRALGVNALDEVPDSTWFTNRIGVRELTPAEVGAGATVVGSPEGHGPFTIHSAKVGGKSLGFIATDARGERFLFKFDTAGMPEVETAAEVIVGRLVWAAGYHVPETHILYVRPDDLLVAADATYKDGVGDKRPLSRHRVEQTLQKVAKEEDGRIRVMASRMLDGKALGGHAGEGTRPGDPNDVIPHELRRDLRGAHTLFAWVDHLDVTVHNTLDVLVTDRADPSCQYVVHYLLDFGKTLGTMTMELGDLRLGYAYQAELTDVLGSLFSLGLQERPWEGRRAPRLRGVGIFDARHFDPGRWKPAAPVYAPLLFADRVDRFWGAKLLMRFTRAQIRAAVEAARLSDPRAAEYLVNTLVARQRATGRHWFLRVNPLDRFVVTTDASGTSLCFDDLLLTYRLTRNGADTRYRATTYDRDARRLGVTGDVTAATSGRTCTGPLPIARDGDGYTIVRVETRRPTFTGATDVHLAREPRSDRVRIIGIWRP